MGKTVVVGHEEKRFCHHSGAVNDIFVFSHSVMIS